jgi:hypothetical protein
MGHASPRVALIYQHASLDRDKVVAQPLGEAFKTARQGAVKGTQRARR